MLMVDINPMRPFCALASMARAREMRHLGADPIILQDDKPADSQLEWVGKYWGAFDELAVSASLVCEFAVPPCS